MTPHIYRNIGPLHGAFENWALNSRNQATTLTPRSISESGVPVSPQYTIWHRAISLGYRGPAEEFRSPLT